MALKIRRLSFVFQIYGRTHFNSYFLFFLLCIGVMIPHGNAWAQQCSGDTVISSNVAQQTNSTWLCSFSVLSGKSITASSNGVMGFLNTSPITALNNAGRISTSGTGSAGIYNDSTLTTFANTGIISTSGLSAHSFYNRSTLTTFTNAGIISTSGSSAYGFYNRGTLTTFTNTGIISTSNTAAMGLYNAGVLTTLTNTGTISTGLGSYGIYNANTLTTLNNLQGASGSPLTYRSILPTNYNIIINSASNYGQLAVAGVTGATSFDIYTGSALSAATYSSVLTGVASSNITNYSSIFNTWNNFNSSYKWELVQGGSSTTWDLVVAARASNIQSGSTNLLSSVGGGLNPILDGGILKVDSATSTSTAFTIKATGGKIDANGLRAIFSGAFSNAVGESGKLTITNTGTAGQGAVVLSTANTHSGGTEVQAGAVLSIASSDALGSGTLALVGSSTVPATLTTTATTTISNAITVTGDPVFNVAPNTTTTVSAAITDGVSAGDVVVSGGGTLALTAANTYTGNTTVDSGSTLVLSGNGSIATSGTDATIGTGVFNNGIFNVTGVSANMVSIGTNFTQSSTGTLAMNFSPTNNQKLNVTGTASLAGSLSLTASSGTYSKGSYTLLSANRITGTFGSLSTNLSSYTSLGYGLRYDASNVYLLLTSSLADTQQSLSNTASALQSSITLQNTVLINSFTYDCPVFDANGICVSAGGRNTQVAAGTINNTSGLLIGSYRLDANNSRIGLSLDQNFSTSMPGGTIKQSNSTPMVSAFGIWQENLDSTGWQAKVSVGMGQKDTTVQRTVVGTSEAGVGSATMLTQGLQAMGKYGFALIADAVVLPYVGVRYTRNNMGGYTEATSSTVISPLTMSKVNTNSSAALIGVEGSYKVMPNVNVLASAGLEHNMSTNYDNYVASSSDISGLTPVSMNPNMVRTRPTASLGAYYDIEKNQRLGINGIYRQEMYQAVGTTSVMATYSVGL